ncbi:MAG: MFS transporter [Propionibacteriaceae bacterium]|nr:MFS transporter [Propionibacteriaceae bacterium]
MRWGGGIGFRGGLWRNRDFRLYWQASTVSAVGTAVTRLALPLVATLTLDASPFAIGLIVFAEEAPLLILGLPAGVWVDRHRRLPLMLWTDLLRAVVLLVVPVAYWLDLLSVPLLVGVALGIGTLSVIFEIAAQAMISTLLPPRDYVEGNSKRYAGEAAATVAGPSLGGAAAQIAGPAVALLVDAGSYLYSFVCLRRMGFVEPPLAVGEPESMLRAVRTGLTEIGRNPYLRPVTLATGCLTFLSGIGWAMLVPFASRTLGLGSATIGLALSVTGVGALLGALLAGRVVARLGLGPALLAGLAATAPGLLIVGLAGGGESLAGALFASGLFLAAATSPVFDINQFSLRQAVTPEPLRGRVVAATRVAIRGCAALGALAGGIVAGTAGLRVAVLVAAVAPLVPLLILWRSPAFALRSMPERPGVDA